MCLVRVKNANSYGLDEYKIFYTDNNQSSKQEKHQFGVKQ